MAEQFVRAFFAIEAPEIVQSATTPLVSELRGSGLRAAWTPPANLHITLRFLGSVPGSLARDMAAFLRARLEGFGAIDVKAMGLGVFPNATRPAVVWLGVTDPEERLARLHGIAEAIAREAGLTPETCAFHPHITLARVKERPPAGALATILKTHAETRVGAWRAGHVSLMESRLSRQGAPYTRLETLPLD